MRNQYPGICYRCGENVAAKEGHFERITKSQYKKWNVKIIGRWLIQHANCAIKYRGTYQHFKFCKLGEE